MTPRFPRRKAAATTPRAPFIDPLEPRTLLAAFVNGGTLFVTGTSNDDLLFVDQSGPDIVVDDNGVITNFPAAGILDINVDAQGGNVDVVVNNVALPSVLTTAATGASTIIGGDGPDTITGGPGDDTIVANDGDDIIDGGAGDDDITGGDGNDDIDGGDDDDIIDADDSQPDTVNGGNGTDNVTADGSDIVSGAENPSPTSPEIALSVGATNINDGQPAAVSFGSSAVQGGPGVSVVFTIANSGTAPLTLGAITVPAGYTLTAAPAPTVAAGGSTTFTLRLNATAAGSFAGPVTIANDDASEAPFNFNVTGTVQAAPVIPPPEINVFAVTRRGPRGIADGAGSPISFGSSLANQGNIARTFRVTNTGGQTLTLGAITVPAGFVVTNALASSLAPGASDDFVIALNTSTGGAKGGTVSFTSNDADESPFNFVVAGTVATPGPQPQITVDAVTRRGDREIANAGPGAVDFGAWTTSTRGAILRTFRVTNTGDGVLNIGNITLPKGFVLIDGLAKTLAPGASDTFVVGMSLVYASQRNGTLSISSNDFDQPLFTFSVTGRIQNPPGAN